MGKKIMAWPPGQDDERLWHCRTCDKRTVIEAVHAWQAGGIQMGVVRQENGRTDEVYMKLKKKRPMNG